MSVYDFNECDPNALQGDDERTLRLQRRQDIQSPPSIFDPATLAYMDKHYFELLRTMNNPLRNPSPTHSVATSSNAEKRKTQKIQNTPTGCHFQPRIRRFTATSALPNLKHKLIDPIHWNPVVAVPRLDTELDQEVSRLQSLILNFEYPKSYFEERGIFENFWKLLLSSKFITLVGDFFIGPNGTYYKPSVRFKNRKDWVALKVELNKFDERREGGHSWQSFMWQHGEVVTPSRAARIIRRELLNPHSTIMGKPCIAVFESLINQNKHGNIEKPTTKGEGFLWYFNRHSWSLVVRPKKSYQPGSKDVEILKIDSIYPKLRQKDKDFSRNISLPIQGFFVRSDISDLVPDYKCILESFLIVIRILLNGDDCRKTD